MHPFLNLEKSRKIFELVEVSAEKEIFYSGPSHPGKSFAFVLHVGPNLVVAEVFFTNLWKKHVYLVIQGQFLQRRRMVDKFLPDKPGF